MLGLQLSDCYFGPIHSAGDVPAVKLRLLLSDDKELAVQLSKSIRNGFENAEFKKTAAQIEAEFASGPISDDLRDVLELKIAKKN